LAIQNKNVFVIDVISNIETKWISVALKDQRYVYVKSCYTRRGLKEYQIWLSVQDSDDHARGMLRDFRKA
jgi:hypothetical protein